jgi:HK97 gp10 family phage protein
MAKDGAELINMDEIVEMINEMPAQYGIAAIKAILHSGASEFREAYKSQSPSEDISKSVRVQTDPDNRAGFLVGPTTDAFHARFMEFGTKIRKTHGDGLVMKKVANRGQMTPKPFAQIAIEMSNNVALDKIFENAGARLERFLKSKTKKLKKINAK